LIKLLAIIKTKRIIAQIEPENESKNVGRTVF